MLKSGHEIRKASTWSQVPRTISKSESDHEIQDLSRQVVPQDRYEIRIAAGVRTAEKLRPETAGSANVAKTTLFGRVGVGGA